MASFTTGVTGKSGGPQWMARTERVALDSGATCATPLPAAVAASNAVNRNRRATAPIISEGESCGELDLARRSRLARGQPRSRDLAERRCADDVAGRGEVGLVEQI